jgi:hypothetical protein
MNKTVTHVRKVLLSAALVMFLVACGGGVSQENYDKIQNDMTMDQVQSILGKPTESSSVDVAGMSGSTATWEGEEGTISIQFMNGKVKAKQFSKAAR